MVRVGREAHTSRVHRCAGRSELSLPPRVGARARKEALGRVISHVGRQEGGNPRGKEGRELLILAISLGASSRCGGMRKWGSRG